MTLKVGDYVKIEPLSYEKKQNYPFGWASRDDDSYDNMDNYIGNVTKITQISNTRHYLECDNGRYKWSDLHLKPIQKSSIILF